MEKLYRKLESLADTGNYPFHMPGHKRNPESVDSDFLFEKDITEISGFDDLHHSREILKEAQERAAKLYEVKETFFSVNGSTAAILAAVSSAVSKGGQILVGRNCHKSVYNAMYIRDLVPSYIYPQEDPVLGISGGISPARVETVLDENPEIQAVLITSPTYDGVVSDVKRIANVAHSHGIPLIVDEAHGAHFKFSNYFPTSAAELGADLVIQSLHKTLPSLTQTAVLHRCSDMVNRNLLRRFMGIYQSSSPSYLLMGSMDACIDKMARDGRNMFIKYTENLEKTRKHLEQCKYIRLVTPKAGRDTRIHDFDRSKIILSSYYSSLKGTELQDILREEFHIETEMACENYVLAMTSVGDTEEGFLRLCQAVEEIDRRESLKNTESFLKEEQNYIKIGEKKQVMSIAEALDSPVIFCPLEESIGKISAEFAYLYPPGIPMITPGEQITGLFVRNVRRYMEQGIVLEGLCDRTNKTICVVKE